MVQASGFAMGTTSRWPLNTSSLSAPGFSTALIMGRSSMPWNSASTPLSSSSSLARCITALSSPETLGTLTSSLASSTILASSILDNASLRTV